MFPQALLSKERPFSCLLQKKGEPDLHLLTLPEGHPSVYSLPTRKNEHCFYGPSGRELDIILACQEKAAKICSLPYRDQRLVYF